MNSKRKVTISALWRFALFVFLLGAAAAVTGVTVYYRFIKGGDFLPQETIDYYEALDSRYGKFYEMQDTVSQESIYPIDGEKLDHRIGESLLESTGDPYAVYYTEEEYESFERKYVSSYTGIGVAIMENEEGKIVITRILEGSPAEEELREGDIIESIDGTEPADLQEASGLITGEAGTEVQLKILREGESSEVRLYRTDVEDKSVRFEEYDEVNRIGLITISSFRQGAAEELKDAVKTLQNRGYDKFIIDVRNNPGGVTQEGVYAADYLLPACKIMSSRNNQGEESVYNSEASAASGEFILLVDNGTASAAEIFAGAVRANGAAKLVGTETYGKGLIQAIHKLRDGSAFKITIEEYFLPGNQKIDGVGLTPDVYAEGDDAVANAVYLLNIGENRP